MRKTRRQVVVRAAAALLSFVCTATIPVHGARQAVATKPAFAALVERLSEPGGDFGGDNLISNEQSYLRVLPALEKAQVAGGAYLGVGPDQNFSYIAALKPAVAFIVDIRRDNLLLHLLFKSIFAAAPTRLEYLCLLTGRSVPAQPETMKSADIDALIAYLDRAPKLAAAALASLRAKLDAAITATGLTVSRFEFDTIHRFHQEFIDAGLSLVFQARGQPVRDYYPNLRVLLRETDGTSRKRSFLASDPDFQFVRALEGKDLVIPVVGDVSGPHAMAAIAAEMRTRGLSLSAFYISNVEYYLFNDGRFGVYVENLKKLPRAATSTVIRSVFPSGFPMPLPQSVPGFYSTSLVQPLGTMLADLAANKYYSYRDLVYASSR